MKRIFLALLSPLLGAACAVASSPLVPGDNLPAVSAMNQDGVLVDLQEAGSEGWLLVFFYPKADTPGCTAQACSLRDAYADLQEFGVTIFGVSTDSLSAQKAFQEKHQLPFSLLADSEKEVVEAFRVPTRMGFASRQAFLFHEGTLVWADFSASTAKQAEDVLKVLANR